MDFTRGGRAYLLKLTTLDKVADNGEKGLFLPPEVLRSRMTYDDIEDIRLPILWAVYSIFLSVLQRDGMDESGMVYRDYVADTITLYLPDFARYIGLNGNVSTDSVNAIISAMEAYQNVIGYIRMQEDGKEITRLYHALKVCRDTDHNTISIQSPYLARLAWIVMDDAVKHKKDGSVSVKRDGSVNRRQVHNYLIKPSIVKQRDHAAAVNVYNIVSLIAQAGNPGKGQKERQVHKRISEIVRQNSGLYHRIENTENRSNRTKILHRTFEKTYDLLRSETWVFESYRGLSIKEVIPTVKTMDAAILELSHMGKATDDAVASH